MALNRITISSLRHSGVSLSNCSLSSCRTSPILSSSRLWQQRRHAKVLDMRFLQLVRPQTHIADKYKALLEEKARREGLESVDELKEAYKDKIQKIKKESIAPPILPSGLSHAGSPPPAPSAQTASAPTPTSTSTSTSTSTPPKPAPTRPPTIPKSVGVKTLDSIVDIAKLSQHDAKEIEYLWRARHINDKNSLCAIIPATTYKSMESLARKHPMFILPLPRENQGVELHLLQWKFSSPSTVDIIFTSLLEYKLKGEFASPHTTITHHLDLLEGKKIVLLQGQVMENRGVSPDEARWLLMALQKFYTAAGPEKETVEAERRRELLRLFSEGRSEFDVGQLIHEVETI